MTKLDDAFPSKLFVSIKLEEMEKKGTSTSQRGAALALPDSDCSDCLARAINISRRSIDRSIGRELDICQLASRSRRLCHIFLRRLFEGRGT